MAKSGKMVNSPLGSLKRNFGQMTVGLFFCSQGILVLEILQVHECYMLKAKETKNRRMVRESPLGIIAMTQII